MNLYSWVFVTLWMILVGRNCILKLTVASDLAEDLPFPCGASYRSVSPLHETNNFVASSHQQVNLFDDADQLGGVDAIEKIVQIDVFHGNDSVSSNSIVAQINTTYLLKNGQFRSVANGKGGVLVGTVRFEEGQYLISIELNVGDVFLNHIRFCRSGDPGACFGPYGGAIDSPSNYVLSKERSVIVCLLGHAADVVNRIRVYYETGKVLGISLDLPSASFQQITTPAVASDLKFHSTESKVTFDNLDGSKVKSAEVMFQETITTFESSEVFNHPMYTKVTIPFSTNEIPLFYQHEITPGGLTNNFSIGISFPKLMSTIQNSSYYAHQFQQTIASRYVVTTLPNSFVVAQVFWRKLMYSYYWKIPVLCFYAANPTVPIVDIESNWMEGTIFGSQAFPESFLSLTNSAPEDNNDDFQTPSPSSIAYALVRREKNAHSANWTSVYPSIDASTAPSAKPLGWPSDVPLDVPSGTPSDSPSVLSSEVPSDSPTLATTSTPSDFSSQASSDSPSNPPSGKNSFVFPTPSDYFSDAPFDKPSVLPSVSAFDSLSDIPSALLSADDDATDDFVGCDSETPSLLPTIAEDDDSAGCEGEDDAVADDDFVDCGTSSAPSLMPSDVSPDVRSKGLSDAPSEWSSSLPSDETSNAPSDGDSDSPSTMHSVFSSEVPSDSPSHGTSNFPSDTPSALSSNSATSVPSANDDFVDCGSGTPTGTPSDRPADPDPDPVAVPVATTSPVFYSVALSPVVLSPSPNQRPISVITSNEAEESNHLGLTSGHVSIIVSNIAILGWSVGTMFAAYFL